jgi:hypothetical protein
VSRWSTCWRCRRRRYAEFADRPRRRGLRRRASAKPAGRTAGWCWRTTPWPRRGTQQAREAAIAALVAEGDRLGRRLDAQDEGTPQRGRPLSATGAQGALLTRSRSANLAHLIKADLQAERFSSPSTRTQPTSSARRQAAAGDQHRRAGGEVVQRYKSLADIERGFRVLKSDIEIAPVYHRLPAAHPGARADLLPGAAAAPRDADAPEGVALQ